MRVKLTNRQRFNVVSLLTVTTIFVITVPKMLWIRSVDETLHDTLTRAALSVLLGNNGKVVNQTAGETAAS